MLYMIGLGLAHETDITVRGLEAAKKCKRVYLEHYTSVLMSANKESLEKFYGREVILADREMVESESDKILENAQEDDVAFLVVGDVFGATTHTDLVIRAREQNIPVESIHNASVMNAVGACGLQLYNFGQAVSIVFFTEDWRPDSFYNKIMENRRIGLHTLLLLDIKVKEPNIKAMMQGRIEYDPPRYMSVATCCQQLLEIEEKRKEEAYTPQTPCIAVSRLGSPNQSFKAGTLEELANYDAGEPLHSVVMLGRQVHDLELDYLLAFANDPDAYRKAVAADQEYFKPPPPPPAPQDIISSDEE
ncbi:diphthine synthase [Pichia kudriavzevii]|uniref:diphthine methyl ester synthase n=1 Tax=Pichia kudriavzevii TaxID=4909 RepID=A0A099P8T1_PICKU|nr:hypothetical protein JL09_g479 [Pichia kudriavzevii]ONH75484.1 Diphthine methyl ester synthase [Pichia kudriavzevii]OUT23868.1 diphthine synthase [Pichia kudriavzevii]